MTGKKETEPMVTDSTLVIDIGAGNKKAFQTVSRLPLLRTNVILI